jgi:hypothetical protein
VGYGNVSLGNYGFAVGIGNQVAGHSSATIGSYNTIAASAGTELASFAHGSGNQIAASVYNASAGGHYNIVRTTNGHALGTILDVNSLGSVVVGQMNAPVNNEDTQPAAKITYRAEDPAFVVGNGYFGTRSNAMVVTKGGMTHIKVPDKGGIDMGAFKAD